MGENNRTLHIHRAAYYLLPWWQALPSESVGKDDEYVLSVAFSATIDISTLLSSLPLFFLTLCILGLLWLYMNPIGDISPCKVFDSTNDNQF